MTAAGRRPLVAANWKMHLAGGRGGDLLPRAASPTSSRRSPKWPSSPPSRSSRRWSKRSPARRWRPARRISTRRRRERYTGDVSAAQLVDAGCRFVICGHSERRRLHGERRRPGGGARRAPPLGCRPPADRLRRRERARSAAAAGPSRSSPVSSSPCRSIPAWFSPTSRCGRSAPARRRARTPPPTPTPTCASRVERHGRARGGGPPAHPLRGVGHPRERRRPGPGARHRRLPGRRRKS